MALFKKKERENLDEIPELPELPDFPDDDFSSKLPDIPSDEPIKNENIKIRSYEDEDLPPLPDIKPKSFAIEKIKKAVSEPDELFAPIDYKEKEIMPEPVRQQVRQPFHMPPKQSPPKIIRKVPEKTYEMPKRTIEIPETYKNKVKETEPVFIRLDKFQLTSHTFEEIKRKVREIENLLEKTKELREREQRELDEWEKDIQAIKARLDSVDRNLFNKLD